MTFKKWNFCLNKQFVIIKVLYTGESKKGTANTAWLCSPWYILSFYWLVLKKMLLPSLLLTHWLLLIHLWSFSIRYREPVLLIPPAVLTFGGGYQVNIIVVPRQYILTNKLTVYNLGLPVFRKLRPDDVDTNRKTVMNERLTDRNTYLYIYTLYPNIINR